MLEIGSFEEFEKYVGQEIGVSSYHKITQEQIDLFAKATLDYQWIHVDTQKAKDGPFGKTIAHGYLTLSLLPYLWEQILIVNNVSSMINYGIDKFKFSQPVLVDNEVRIRVNLLKLTNLRGVCKAELKCTLEIKDSPKNAFEGEITFLYNFNK